MVDPQIRVGIDVGCKAHRVGIADPKDSLMEEFDSPKKPALSLTGRIDKAKAASTG